MSANTSDDSHPVDRRLPLGRTILLGVQHVLIMYAGVVVVPILFGTALGLTKTQLSYLVSIDLVLSGIGTLLQALGLWKFGIRMPLVVGAASNGIVPMIIIGQEQGLNTVYGTLLVVGVLWVLITPLFAKLIRYFPPVVTGTVVVLIGISLLPVGAKMIAGSDPGSASYGSPKNIGVAAITLLLMVIFYRVFRGILNQLATLMALVLGAIIGFALNMSSLSDVGHGPVIGFLPPFHFGPPEFDPAAIALFLVIMFVLMVEGAGQGLALGQVTEREVDGRSIARLLRVDGLMTALSGVFNGFAYTTFGQNIGLITLTKVRSRFPVAFGGVVLILLGVVRPVGRFVAAIPQPVVGAAALATFAALAVSGLRVLINVDFRRTGNLVIALLALAVGLIPAGAPDFYKQFPDSAQLFLNSGVASGTVVAVVLNLVFHEFRRKKPTVHDPEIPAQCTITRTDSNQKT